MSIFFSRIFLCLVAVLSVSAAAGPRFFVEKTGTSDIPKELSRKFRRDAARISLRIEADKEDLKYLSIFIPKSNTDQIYTALTTIWQNEQTAQRLAKCNVHTFPSPSIDHFVVIYDKNVAWAKPLADGINETGSAKINDLLDKYNLVIEKHINWTDNQDAITLRSRDPLNIAALANEFQNIDGVAEIDLGIPKILGNDINAWRVAGGWEIEYILRFGSWSAGKGKQHIWKYKFSDAGKVQFLAEWGDEIPAWMQCELRKEEENFAQRG